MNPIIRDIKQVLLSQGFDQSYIIDVSTSKDVIEVTLLLPYHREQEDIEMILNNIKEELLAHDAKIKESKGKLITLSFGKRDLSEVPFHEEYINENSLKISLPSAYGCTYLDFADSASCHLLNGGTTRMGKTIFLLYLSTMLYIQQKGNIQLHITSTKIKDYYPFKHIENVTLTDNEIDFTILLHQLIEEYKFRNRMLHSPMLEKAKDSKDVIEKYPSWKDHFKPIFVVIDEYARFSENKEIQKMIMELVETAGYVNIHIIISTQRPDARTVLHPRIKSNLLARICFTTADKNNSLIILDQEGAERLGKIKGRAIFLDSDTNIIQVPNISYDQVETLLLPYKILEPVKNLSDKKEIEPNEQPHHENETGSTNHQLTEKIQSLFTESDRTLDLQEQHEPNQCSESGIKENGSGWDDLENHTRERPNVLLHTEPKISYKPQPENSGLLHRTKATKEFRD